MVMQAAHLAPEQPTARTVARCWPLFAGIMLMMLGNGLQGTLLGTRAILAGFGEFVTGLVMAGYFAGFIISAEIAPRLIRRIGHVRCYAAFAACASVAVLVHGLVVVPPVWAIMRFVTGFCLAGIYIVSESWLNCTSENRNRGSLLSIYTTVLLLSVAGGQFVVAVGDPRGLGLFIVSSALVSLAVLPMVLSITPAPDYEKPERLGIAALARRSPIGAVLAFGSGLIFGAYGGMGAAFATGIGFDTVLVALFMAVIGVAGGLMQWPLGALSDLLPRRLVIAGTAGVASAAAFFAAQLGADEPFRLIALAGIFGGTALPLYALALATANDQIANGERVAASSTLVLLYGSGSLAGPIISSGLMELIGSAGYFFSLTGICACLAAWAALRGLVDSQAVQGLRRRLHG